VIVGGAGEVLGIATATVSQERLASVRKVVPSLEHRRFRVLPA
jgi:hypothetical protein